MASTENTLKDWKKDNLFTLVINVRNDPEKLMEKFYKHLDHLSNTVDNNNPKFQDHEFVGQAFKSILQHTYLHLLKVWKQPGFSYFT